LRTEIGDDRGDVIALIRIRRAIKVIPAAAIGAFGAGVPPVFTVGVDADDLRRVDAGSAGEAVVRTAGAVEEEHDGAGGVAPFDAHAGRGDIELDLAFGSAVDAIGANDLGQVLRTFWGVGYERRRKGADGGNAKQRCQWSNLREEHRGLVLVSDCSAPLRFVQVIAWSLEVSTIKVETGSFSGGRSFRG